MERKTNICGEIINGKFSHLLSTDVNTTWQDMKQMLDKEMPVKKKRKWLFWFSTKAVIITIILFLFFAATAGIYLGNGPQPGNAIKPAAEIKKQENSTPANSENEKNTDKVNATPVKQMKPAAPAIQTKARRIVLSNRSEEKTTARPEIPGEMMLQEQIKNFPLQPAAELTGDSIAPAVTQTTVTEKKKGF